MHLDETDQGLIAALRADARASTAELARRLGLSRTTVQSRIERLERSGVIAGYTVRMGEEFEKGRIEAFVLITVSHKAAAGVIAAARRMPAVQTLFSVSGAFDLIARIAAGAIGDIDRTIDALGALEGVERTVSSVVLATKLER
jgi:DNA-binding Lrp family transcriptional regulator